VKIERFHFQNGCDLHIKCLLLKIKYFVCVQQAAQVGVALNVIVGKQQLKGKTIKAQ